MMTDPMNSTVAPAAPAPAEASLPAASTPVRQVSEPSPVELPQTRQAMPQQGRSAAFFAGATGNWASTTAHPGIQADPAFHGGSILTLPNTLATGNAQSGSTFMRSDPYDSSMKTMLASQQSGQQ